MWSSEPPQTGSEGPRLPDSELDAAPSLCALGEALPCACRGQVFFGRELAGQVPRTADELRALDFFEKNVSGQVECSARGIGDDPAPGKLKQCWCVSTGAGLGLQSQAPPQDERGLVRWLTGGGASLQLVSELGHIRRWLESIPSAPRRAEYLAELLHSNEWTKCASERESCPCPSGIVRYGVPHAGWVYRNFSSDLDRIHCSASTFFNSDPDPVHIKSCECLAAWRAARCRDGGPVDWSRCPAGSDLGEHLASAEELRGERYCRAGCSRGPPGQLSGPGHTAPRKRQGNGQEALCGGDVPHELLWSCEAAMREASRLPPSTHAHVEAQTILNLATAEVCSARGERYASQFSVFLDCEFVDNYLRWTNDTSDWLDDAYVTYLGGRQNSVFEWQTMNLIRSAHFFSSRPVVVVLFGTFVPPLAWRAFPNVIVYRMHPGLPGVSHNFNKIRAMIAARTLTGIELDTDQIVYTRMDTVFGATRRECTAFHPFPILPVHWMSRDAKKPERYWQYAFKGYDGVHTMRWCHAHPSWTYWALPFLADLLLERFEAQYAAQRRLRSLPIRVWNLTEIAGKQGLRAVLDGGHRQERVVLRETWMEEDEDMLNVALWRAGVQKAWCKFDNYPQLYVKGREIPPDLYRDSRWYPEGLPILFYSSHATKDFEYTDWLVTLLVHCDQRNALNATEDYALPIGLCEFDGLTMPQRWARSHHPDICCCIKPRQETPIFWRGAWYSRASEIQQTFASEMPKCIFP